jgi:UDP-GlcNAc:undecaprenyl-phosphate GlcNAc-1-phosphate transferase
MDVPDVRKIHARPTPRLGGLAVVSAVVASLAANGALEGPLLALVAASAGLFLVGAADDMGGISARLRLGAQIAASIAVMQAGIVLKVLPGDAWPSLAGNRLLTLLWLVGITNAFNFFDGMDGLASGLAIVMSAFLGAVAFQSGQPHLGWASVAVIGAAAAFLPGNFRIRGPAAVFLGDGGSTFLGFLLAGLAVHGEWGTGGVSDLTAPLLVFGVIVYDMIHTTVARIARGDVRSVRRWIEYTGRDHLHHRFEALLRSRKGSVLLILLLQSTLGLGAMVLRGSAPWGQGFLLLQCAAILLVVTVLEHAGNLHERRGRDR